MIYDSIEIIPAKIYFKIAETGELTLLSSERITESISKEKLKIIWDNIEEQHSLIAPNKEVKKVLNLSKKIESLAAKFEAVSLSVHHLKAKEDEELIELLKVYGYQFTENLSKDLEKIQRESEAIKIKIESISDKMPKPNENNNDGALSFDEAVMSYSAFTGAGFINTNNITLTQYYALINIGNKKIKALESGGKR